jgi:hypothetical protein
MWVAPDKTEFESSDKQKPDISVTVNSRRDYCILNINAVSKSHAGYWECVITEGRDVVGKFAFLRTFESDGSSPLKLLLDHDAVKVTTQRGADAVLNCPSNNVAQFSGQRPACRWLTPGGQSLTLVG